MSKKERTFKDILSELKENRLQQLDLQAKQHALFEELLKKMGEKIVD